MEKITPAQLEILKLAKEKEFVTISDARIFYSSKEYLINALSRLVDMGYLRISDKFPNRYDYTKKELEND